MRPDGPPDARIMIVGEAPGESEIYKGLPFVGASGMELNRMLDEAGILRSACFLTNVCNERPPRNEMDQWVAFLKNPPKASRKYSNTQWVSWRGIWVHPAVQAGYAQLIEHIKLVRPRLVIALGNTALFALTGKRGIKSWRGSQLLAEVDGHQFKVIPTYHPAAVLRQWTTRAVTVHDLRRAKNEAETVGYTVPHYERIIRPKFGEVLSWLHQLSRLLDKGPVEVSTDIETRAGHISCTGFYTPGLPTLCIPWMCIERREGYWTEDEEVEIRVRVAACMSHPHYRCTGQNWPYDAQYKWRFFFIQVMPAWDTMTAQHCMFPGTPKGLDYLASLYCQHYVYWKDDGKNLDPHSLEDETRGWNYNCEDCERTYEVSKAQQAMILNDPRLRGVWEFQNGRLARLLIKAMFRGIRTDTGNKAALSASLDSEIKAREAHIAAVCGHQLNFRSPLQVRSFFYEDLKLKPIKNRKTGEVTVNDEALEDIRKKNPLLRDFIKVIQELRSIGVFKSTFVDMRLDRDHRIRCSFNITGTMTFRLSSSENAFGSGLNLQNIPKGEERKEGQEWDPDKLELPNVRKLFLPDPGHDIFDMDLRNADFYTVVWEADDEQFREALARGVDMHLLNAGTLYNVKELLQMERYADEDWVEHCRDQYYKQRDFAKRWVHGTDFGGGDRTMAATVGITIRENEKFRLKWFGEHPGIKRWHDRTEQQLMRHRWVENRFGYRCYFFDRPEGLLPEALAWVPQSTTGCVINRAWDQIDQTIPEAEVLIQVHDSLVGQYETSLRDSMRPRLTEAAKVVVPYPRPLVIPVGLKVSDKSWGHCG